MLNKHVVITGGSSGLGRELALELRSAASITLIGRDRVALAETKDLIANNGLQTAVRLEPCNLVDRSDRARLLTRLKDGPAIDTLILNAGGGPFGRFAITPFIEHTDTVELNLVSNMDMVHGLLPKMVVDARAGGYRARVIVIASHAAFLRIPNFAVYASCKLALARFVQTLALEFKSEPVDFLTVFPGATATKFSERANIPLMLSKPADANRLARSIVSLSSSRRLYIPQLLDKIVFIVGKIIPERMVDHLVMTLQNRFLSKSKR